MGEAPNAEESTQELTALRAELQRAREDLERFAFFVSHDFRAPLRHIHAFSALLKAELKDHESRDINTWLGFMGDGATLIQELVDEVLAFSRARRAEAVPGTTDVSAMLKRLEAAALTPEEGLEVSQQIAADVVVAMPSKHAQQVFEHLLRNAIYFRKADSAAQLTLSAKRDSTMWVIEIRDEGRGIPDAVIGRVFEPFYRSSDSARESPGLGLSVARHLLSLYGGSIELESEVGRFTVARVRLPAA